MSAATRIVLVSFFVLVVGSLFLKGYAGRGSADPTTSVQNGAPRGLLAAATWLASRGVTVVARRDFDEALPAGPAVLLVPPPESAHWTEAEVTRALAAVERGALDVVVLCDEDPARNARLAAWFQLTDSGCSATGKEQSTARGTMPGFAGTLAVRFEGRVALPDEQHAIPAWVDESGGVVVTHARVGAGRVTVVGSASIVANDGLAKEDAAAFLASLVPAGATVVVDEAHHRSRRRDALAAAWAGVGPKTALLALVFLVPLSLLSLAPRPGDPPRGPRTSSDPLAARAQARALAALFVAAKRLPPVDDPPGA